MRVLVVGSGASSIHFAWTLLERGHDVTLVDVGRERAPAVRPQDSFEELKRNLPDPVSHFLGRDFEAVTYPGAEGEYYGFPPDKLYIFEGLDGWDVKATGFSPLHSFAQGGLAEAWTAGVFPFNKEEISDFPFAWDDLERRYATVAERIGVSGAADDLTRHIPWHDHIQSALPMDEHAARLLDRYSKHRAILQAQGVTLGRSRVAVLTEDRDDRPACGQLGRCLLGCPTDSLWIPSMGLRELIGRPGFTYRSGLRVQCLLTEDRTVRGLVAARVDGSGEEEFTADRVALGAGTLGSTRIFLETWRRLTGETPRLGGLMDNRQVLLPFVNLGMIPRAHCADTYQYHQLAFGLTSDDPKEYVHGLVTTLKTASIHPIVQSLPFDLRTSLFVFRNLHAALGLVNVNFPDSRRDSCWVGLDTAGPTDGERPLIVHYEPRRDESSRIAGTLRRFRRSLQRLGCVVPPRMSHLRPMGSSVHYAGTLPMASDERPFTTDASGASRDLSNLWFVDGTTFPFLPAKNLTFTLMANATRIAEEAF